MMSVDIMMSLIFRCRHHDESEHNDGRVSPLVNKGEPHFANISLVLSRLLLEERDVLSLCVCVFFSVIDWITCPKQRKKKTDGRKRH
jgi:hypothetical protein